MITVLLNDIKRSLWTASAYVFVGLFLAISALVFFVSNVLTGSSDLANFLSMMGYLWMLLCPLLVMKGFPEEKRQGTFVLLATAPQRMGSIVLAKYLANCAVLLAGMLLSLVFPAILSFWAMVYWPEVMVGYLGFALQGMAFIALDLMVSCLFSRPIAAAIAAFGVNVLVWLGSLIGMAITQPTIRQGLLFFSLYDRGTPFLMGQLSFANLAFFVIFSGIMILWSTVILSANAKGDQAS